MCLSCGYYKGRQVLDLTALKARRDERIKAKKERITADAGVDAPTEVKAAAPIADEVAEVAPKTKRPRATKTGSSSKKEKQESS